MSRTDKDRPYDVQVADLRAQGKTRSETYIAGSLGASRPSPYVDRNLTKSFLKGDIAGIKAHRELLAGEDVTVNETEFKLPVFKISCSAAGDDHHETDDTFYQYRHIGWSARTPFTDLFPQYKRDNGILYSACCFPVSRATRTIVHFEVFQNYTPTVRVVEVEDYDSRLITFTGGRSKTRTVERRRRTKARAALHNLSRSTQVEDDWDSDAYRLGDPEVDSYWD